MLLKRTGARRSSYDPELNHVPFGTEKLWLIKERRNMSDVFSFAEWTDMFRPSL